MQHRGVKHLAVAWGVATLALASVRFARAEDQTPEQSQDQTPVQPQDASQDRVQQQPRVLSRDRMPDEAPVAPIVEQPMRAADGRRHTDLPLEAYAVVPGTKFLVRLEDELGTKETREKKRFKVITLEPLEAGQGIYLPPGAEIRGHVSRAEPAGVAGRAKLWLTFDEIHTKFATLPIVAEVASVPGDHSVRTGTAQQEGLIEGRTSTQQAAAEAAAAGAALGAVRGVKDKDPKEAAEGAAAAAIAAYLVESGRGHEIDLPKGAKLELELERALYLLKE
ncbi:MAG TPA: hypothetical protein VKQ28_03075 [Candidatus Acidoferrum sp.]|nr:hypothetical protein [Candidatus Acidoferrum sp.]